ncbi:isopeptide-forming domain-containing fimbrial protein [Macrococcus hajekii]|uniref:Isopeptide-forming domain-containing fimbrial protein n=1 Tax=Macrococcus hajekii TaxID=198482 RepID=A0A4R6BJH6_9STAP|nr:SpaH/EbpB family LPXTG-anchored major pilin [Macrococcus hajekii]TDM01807.1 isopeptide-forming domain-containing fimbrial protein [Macrococcus hajekii]GGB07632.1 hypothetical protein GCM10007190_14520 [Macrococcus hajekii]
MSKFTKYFSLFLILSLLISLFSPFTAHAASPSTNVTIHKITGDTARTATYDELTNTTPPAGDPISNISFTYWKVTEDQFNTMIANSGSYETAAQVSAYVGSAATGTTGNTAADGTVQVAGLAEGYYWFIENPSTAVATSAAVPFGLALPITNQAGTGYITDLHVYPKNTLEEVPTIDKDIATDNNKLSTFDIGQSFNWIIQPTTPKGIDEYANYTVTDTLNAVIDFDNTKQITATIGGTTLTAGTDFNATYDAGTRLVTVKFTSTGLKNIAAAGPDAQLNILVPTVINNQAVMGQKIPNTATLTYDNNHGLVGSATVADADIPAVQTGGKKFVKTDGTTNLSGAQFVVKKGDQYLIQDPATLVVTWGTRDAATVFTSDTSGNFEVKGLAFGDYQLEEIQAPTGYTIPTNPLTGFTVNENSYTLDSLQILNKKSILPNTGGMGTILFTVVGLMLMTLAIILYRRKKQA